MNNKSTLQLKLNSFLTNLKMAKLFKNAIWADQSWHTQKQAKWMGKGIGIGKGVGEDETVGETCSNFG